MLSFLGDVANWQSRALPHVMHFFRNFYVADGNCSCHLYQKKADIFLGVPFKHCILCPYFTLMMAQVCGLQPGEFNSIPLADATHLTTTIFEQVALQLSRPQAFA